jgi:hypothetical protein
MCVFEKYNDLLFMTPKEHFVVYCRCREAVQLSRFLLSPYSLIGAFNNMQNCTYNGIMVMGVHIHVTQYGAVV